MAKSSLLYLKGTGVLEKIVSGGQAGVDRAALDAAMALGIDIGGWCPRGRRAIDGEIPAKYPLKETRGKSYQTRTMWNVRDSDATRYPDTSRGSDCPAPNGMYVIPMQR